jgi:indole-3-glycerol phosphate synthase
MDILKNIIGKKLKELEYLKKSVSISTLEKSSFFEFKTKSLSEKIKQKEIGIIAEHKRRSPSKSKINYQTPSKYIIKGYDNGGAAGISFLTEKKFFGGSSLEFREARRITNLPMLRKDFIIDEYQIIESKSIGADAILLIAACLDSSQIKNLSELAKSFDLEVLIEIHDLEELNKVCIDSIDIIGINNRNLKTFDVNIETSLNLVEKIPSSFTKISESGLNNPSEIMKLKNSGFDGFLIGERFMRNSNPGEELSNFISKIKNES